MAPKVCAGLHYNCRCLTIALYLSVILAAALVVLGFDEDSHAERALVECAADVVSRGVDRGAGIADVSPSAQIHPPRPRSVVHVLVRDHDEVTGSRIQCVVADLKDIGDLRELIARMRLRCQIAQENWLGPSHRLVTWIRRRLVAVQREYRMPTGGCRR